MKNFKIWGIMMLMVIGIPMMSGCGGDDSDGGSGNDGSAAAYTEEEIIDLLQGTWSVGGDLSITFADSEESVSSDYSGTLQFSQKTSKYYKFKIDSSTEDFVKYFISSFIPDYSEKSYLLLKKSGKYYVAFGKYNYNSERTFEIVSISKTTFKMVMDADTELYDAINKGYKVHCHMTLVSK